MAPQVELQRVTEPADEADILREQLDYLIDHAARGAECGCAACHRYLRVRAILLEIFQEPQATKVREIPTALARAA